ncbi:MAG: hypothetical protein E7624_05150 [Ruminococcaceae bacterium]|nr:hypothetical protein [Oscillospiraceae bacterium]
MIMMPVTFIIISLVLVVCFTSCRQDNTQLAKDEFSRYDQGQNEVALVLDDTVYFEEGEIDLKALKPDEEPNKKAFPKAEHPRFRKGLFRI